MDKPKPKSRRPRSEVIIDLHEGRLTPEQAAAEMGVPVQMLMRTPRPTAAEIRERKTAAFEARDIASLHQDALERSHELYEFSVATGNLKTANEVLRTHREIIADIARVNGLEEGLQQALKPTVNIAQLNMQSVFALPGLNLGTQPQVIDATPMELIDAPQD